MSGVNSPGLGPVNNAWKSGEIPGGMEIHEGLENVGSSSLENIAAAKARNLEEFRSKYSPDVSPEQMKDYMEQGRELENLLADPNITMKDVEWLGKQHGLEGIRNLMWRLTEKAASTDELYTSGAMRQPDKGGKLNAFILAAGGESVYSRISSHMKENIKKGQPQKGVDLTNLGLPAGKRTLLFAKQPDGTLYLKMEERGCPPFWKKGFRSVENFTMFAHHTADFAITRFKEKSPSIYATRKEHVPKELKKEYQKVMDFTSGISTKQSRFQKLVAKFNKPEGERAAAFKDVKEGQKRGISEMDRRLEAADFKADNSFSKAQEKYADAQEKLAQANEKLTNAMDNETTNQALKEIEDAEKEISQARDEADHALVSQRIIGKFREDYLHAVFIDAAEKGYTGEIKGEEVLLPPLGS